LCAKVAALEIFDQSAVTGSLQLVNPRRLVMVSPRGWHGNQTAKHGAKDFCPKTTKPPSIKEVSFLSAT